MHYDLFCFYYVQNNNNNNRQTRLLYLLYISSISRVLFLQIYGTSNLHKIIFIYLETPQIQIKRCPTQLMISAIYLLKLQISKKHMHTSTVQLEIYQKFPNQLTYSAN